jgi:tetratricopeptide (TPR) repeat protein
MTSAPNVGDLELVSRRKEIVEWHASLTKRTDTEILGIGTGASPAEVKAAFVSLARRFHPDTVGGADADLREPLQAIFVRVIEAYRNLGGERSLRRVPDSPLRPAPVPRQAARSGGPAARATARPAAATAAVDAAERRARVDDALRTAEELVARQQTEDAVAVLHDVLTQADGPRRRCIRLLLARAYAVDPRWRRNAVVLLRELVEQNAADAEALAALGSLYQREGLLTRAAPTFARALAADPGLAAARDGLRAVRAALAARQTPAATKSAPRRGLIARLFSVAR